MKIKHLFVAMLTATALWSCGDDYDDTALRNDVDDLKSRVEKLETWCATMDGQISALQGLVTALEANDYVTGVSPLSTNDGYTITFSKSEAITIYNGKDGANGANGITPVVGVNKDADGFYYWTVKVGDAEAKWLTDAAGKKIRTTGDAGAEPKISVAADTDGKLYWQVNGKWLMNGVDKVPATGEKGVDGETGADGAQGDAVFAANGVKVNEANVEFTLADGTTKFILPRVSEIKIFDTFDTFIAKENKALTLALNLKKSEYTAIKAEIINNFGTGIDIKKATRAVSAPWGVALTDPEFDTDGTITTNAKVNFKFPAGIVDGEFALLKVTIVDLNGNEHASTRVIEYSSVVDVEAVELAATATVPMEKSIQLEATVTPANASNKELIWSSSNSKIATVDQNGKVEGIAMGDVVITATSKADNSIKTECTVTVTEAIQTPEVGSFYYSDGTCSTKLKEDKTCIGIVFWVNPDNTDKGKIISLDNSGTTPWGNQPTVVTNATDEDNGAINMATIKALDGTFANYPAFKWCEDHGTGWYLPAMNEVRVIGQNLSALNKSIGALRQLGKADGFSSFYFSSTEKDKDNVFPIELETGKAGQALKYAQYGLRAIMAF